VKKHLTWLWFPVGILLGLALGLGYAWVIRPADFRGGEPAALQPVYRGEYILLIATAYQATGDLDRARSRLALFPELDAGALSSLAQQVVAGNGSEEAARGLARLSVALAEPTASPAVPTVQVAAATATRSPAPTGNPTLALTLPALPTATSKPTVFSTPTPLPGYALVSREQICNAKIVRPLIQVLVRTSDGKGVPGVEILIQWDGGGARFVTGMKPELSAGYADYEIEPGKTYQITLGDGRTVVTNLAAPTCPAATAASGGTPGASFAGSWRLVFETR
jgi:hypothetical protein